LEFVSPGDFYHFKLNDPEKNPTNQGEMFVLFCDPTTQQQIYVQEGAP